ncbi:MAG: histidine kinase [Peptococcaceae bacterium]|nr:histidine kinase [Peptococcaceae bacterium]
MWKKLFNNRNTYYLASIIFIVLGLIYFAACLQHPYIGLDLEKNDDQWFVMVSDPHGEGYRSGIEVGDQILKINGEDPGNYNVVRKWGQLEGASTIEFCRPGESIGQKATIQNHLNFLTLLSETPLVILGFFFWYFGYITWFKRPFLEQTRTLFWMNWLFGLATIFSRSSARWLPLAKELELTFFSLAPVFLIVFFSIFPVKNQNRINGFGRKITIVLFIVILILTALNSLGFVQLAITIKKLALCNMLIGILISVWNLSLAIRLPKDRPEKNEAGIILLGMVIGFLPSVLFVAIPTIFNFQLQYFYTQIIFMFVATVPLSLYYIIVNKYLHDSRRLCETIITYFFAGIIFSFVLLYVLYLTKIVNTITTEIYFTSFFFTMLFIVCFHLIRIAISKIWRKYGLLQKQHFKHRIVELNDNLTFLFAEDRILEETVQKLGIDGAFIIVENAQTGCLKKAVGRFEKNCKEQGQLEEYFHKNQSIALEAKILPDHFPAEIYVPFTSHNSSCGIFFGHRYSRVKFEQGELYFVTLLAGQLAYQLLTMQIMEELTKEIDFLNRNSWNWQSRNLGLQEITYAMFRKLEQERKQLAGEISDGPLQVSLDLNRWLKYLEKEGLSGSNTLQVVSQMRELTEDLKYELSMILNELRPPILDDLGLIPAVELLCKEIMFKELTFISLEKKGISRDQRFKEEVELTAYRFLQKGIMNSIKYSSSKKQRIQIELSGVRLELTVSDSGGGFDAEQLENWLITGVHFGLGILKEHIERLGGELLISSGIQQGTTLKATLPVN